MSKRVVSLCDGKNGSKPCEQPATEYRVWKDGESEAAVLDLCDKHAGPLLNLTEGAAREPLPTKPRRAMQPTQLKTTRATKGLKRT